MFTLSNVLIILAVVPAIVLLVVIYRQDKLEKEPIRMILGLVLLGIISTAFAIIAERIGTGILNLLFQQETILYHFLMYFIVVACSEEGFKYLLLKTKTWTNPNFNCQFDGVIYAVAVSLGFALWENISYVMSYGFETAIIRAVTAIPGHACFGVFMGAWYGISKKYFNLGMEEKSKATRKLSLIIPIIMHGFYDFLCTIDSPLFSSLFVVFVIVMFLICIYLVKKLSKNDKYIDGKNEQNADDIVVEEIYEDDIFIDR